MMSGIKQKIAYHLERTWYGKTGLTAILRPFSWIFIVLSKLRLLLFKLSILQSQKMSVPVIIVGNITVGGTGKTPLVIWIANYLKSAGFKPGIISRGYGGKAKKWPQQVRPDADPYIVGDEAVVIARQTKCPMAVGPNRLDDINALLKYSDIDIVISDDGLQHYALQRDVEIVVIDGIRRWGNGHCLPAGPLRESPTRINDVDFRITNGIAAQGEYAMKYTGDTVINMSTHEKRPVSDFKDMTVEAIAGIGNPDRFFNYLRTCGIRLNARSFPDHHHFESHDLGYNGDQIVLMTEKDAVKCLRLANEKWWYLPISASLPDEFGTQLLSLLGKSNG